MEEKTCGNCKFNFPDGELACITCDGKDYPPTMWAEYDEEEHHRSLI